VYENSLDGGGVIGDRRLEPISEYGSTGEFSTQSTDLEGALKNGIVVLDSLISPIYNALNEFAAHDPSKSMKSTRVGDRIDYGIKS
jgi:hypothetical protein